MMNWMDNVIDAIKPASPPAARPVTVTPADLRAAARVYNARNQVRNYATCIDMAAKLERYGSFVSEKQAGYAAKLCEWAGTEPAAKPAPVRPAPLEVPQLGRLLALDKFARLTIGRLVFTLKNDGSVVWVKRGPTLVGKIEAGAFSTTRDGHADRDALYVEIGAIEADPVRALEDHGLRTGRCGCCSRPLTNPASIARGIGPTCLERGGFL